MVYALTPITILLSAVSILISLIVYGSIRDKVKFPVVVDFVAFLTAVDLFLWHLMPAILRFISGGQHEVVDGIDASEILQVYFIEFASLLFFYVSFIAIFRVSKLNFVYLNRSSVLEIIRCNRIQVSSLYSSYSSLSMKPQKLFSQLIVAMGVYFELQRLILGAEPGIMPALDWLLVPVVIKSSFLLLLHNVFTSKLSHNRLEPSASLLLLFLLLGMGAVNGSHGNIFAPVLYILFYNIFHNRNNTTLYVGFLLVMFLALFYEEMHQVRAYQQMADVERTGTIEKLGMIVGSESPLSETHTAGSGFLDKVEWRFGENSRMSVGYLRMYDEGASAGLNPVANSLYLLPRSFYPEKPIPGSVDGTELGLGMRLMHREIRGTLWNMSGFFTGLHSYWEFGLGGVALISLIIGMYSALLLLFCGNFYYLGLPLIIIMYDTWWAMPKLWSYEVSIQLFNLLIPFLAIWFFFKAAYKTAIAVKRWLLIKPNIPKDDECDAGAR